MEFRLLGPVGIWEQDRPVSVGGTRERTVLALLALQPGQVVGVDRLVDTVWGAQPPATVRKQVHTSISRLRRVLGSQIATIHDGYVLHADPGQIDVSRFEARVTEAFATAAAEQAGELLRAALGLWRGPALTGVRGLALEAARLEERRLTALEGRIEADLAAGRHDDLVAELTSLVAHHPLRERLHGQLMLSLYRTGRQADALEVYRELRARLVGELGVEPGRALQQLERRLLNGDPALGPLGGPEFDVASLVPPVPRQLPADIASFTGRAQELAELDRLVAHGGAQAPVIICAIHGAGGSGKSALAVHAAHRLAGRFPDGQLYVNLQGATDGVRPLRPQEVLGRFLRALGASGRLPTNVDEAAAHFRSQVASRRLLMVLDNADDDAQVAPLLPAAPGSVVLVTSRRVLTGLDGACHLQLDALPRADAVSLLGRLAGPERVAAQPQAIEQLARWCADLPLALRIAGARLAARPTWPVAELASRLADQQRRLDELQLADTGVRASFGVSYRQLADSADPVDRAAAAAFPLLGVLDGPDVGVPAAARLLNQPEDAAERALERLVDAHLLEAAAPGRYRMHDLLRLTAREHAARLHSGDDRAAALRRVFGMYTATAWRAFAMLQPNAPRVQAQTCGWTGGLGFAGVPAALAWLEAERANLVAAAQQAAEEPGVPDVTATQLADALFGFFVMRSYWQDWVQVNQTAVNVARRTGDRTAEALALNDLGFALGLHGRFDEALAHLHRALEMRRELGDRGGSASTLTYLAIVYGQQGWYEAALTHLRQSLAIRHELGLRWPLATTVLGILYRRLGRHTEAFACLQESLAAQRELRDRYGEGISLANLGLLYELKGRHAEAFACLQESLAIRNEFGDHLFLTETLRHFATVHLRRRQHQDALSCLRRSLALSREFRDPYGQAESLRELGVTLHALGRLDDARAHWQQALAVLEQLHNPEADDVRALLAGTTPGP